MMKLIHTLLRDESGTTLIEYSLVAAMLAVFAIAALQATGNSMSTLFFGPVNNALTR